MMTPPLSPFFLHLLVAYAVLGAPWVGRWRYRSAQRRIRAGDPLGQVRLFRGILVMQAVTVSVFCGVFSRSEIPWARLGLCAPRSWGLSAGLAAAILGYFLWNVIRLRSKADKLRDGLQGRAGALLPRSPRELRWFALVSLGSGPAEELIFRGFLFYYFALFVPRTNSLVLVLLTSAIFGMAHLYQGWKGVASTGIAGLILGSLYALSGSLLLPAIIHSAGNLQGALVFRSNASSGSLQKEAT